VTGALTLPSEELDVAAIPMADPIAAPPTTASTVPMTIISVLRNLLGFAGGGVSGGGSSIRLRGGAGAAPLFAGSGAVHCPMPSCARAGATPNSVDATMKEWIGLARSLDHRFVIICVRPSFPESAV